MPREFIIESTSARGYHEQKTIVSASGDPIDAIIEALRFQLSYTRELVEPYDNENDPSGAYEGWSRIVISIDGQYDENGAWRGEADPPLTPLEQLAEVGKELNDGA